MTRNLFIFIFANFLSLSSLASNQVLMQFGDLEICKGTNEVLKTYMDVSNKLQQLKSAKKRRFDEIERNESALQMLAEGLNPDKFGLVVTVAVDGPKLVKPNIPKIEING